MSVKSLAELEEQVDNSLATLRLDTERALKEIQEEFSNPEPSEKMKEYINKTLENMITKALVKRVGDIVNQMNNPQSILFRSKGE